MTLFENATNIHEKWDFIISFISTWAGKKIDINCHTDEIKAFEEKARIELPISFKKWIAFSLQSDQMKKYFSYRDILTIEWMKEFDTLTILMQGEEDFYWGIKRIDLKQDDPPIFGYYLDYDSPEEKFIEQGIWSPSTSSFAFEYLLTYFNSDGGMFSTNGNIDSISESLTQEYGNCTTFGNLQIFNNNDTLIFTSLCEDTWHSEVVNVHFRTPVQAQNMPPILKTLYDNSYIRAGNLVQ